MVKYSTEKIDRIFYSLSDSTRRKILERVSIKSLNVSEIAKPFDISLPAISKHLKILERAKLVQRQRIGREFRFRLSPKPLREVSRYISYYSKFWNEKLDNLEKYLKKGGEKK